MDGNVVCVWRKSVGILGTLRIFEGIWEDREVKLRMKR